MRSAFYHPCAVPPRDWLFFAALLWERIQVSDFVRVTLCDRPEYVASNADAAMLLRLMTETNICTTEMPATAEESLSAAQQQAWTDYLRNARRGMEFIISMDEIPEAQRVRPSTEQIVTLATLMNQVMLHHDFTALFPNVDFFFADDRSFVTGTHSPEHLLLRGVEAVVPKAPSEVSMAQLESFRADTAVQRQRCRDLMASELRRFQTIATEEEFLAALRHITALLCEQLALLEIRCRQHKVDVIKKVFGLTLAAPAALQVMSSVLAVPFLQPAAVLSVLSIAAADYLAARERHNAELRTAPWAYLLNLKDLQ